MQITDPVMVRSLVRDEAATYLAPFLHEDHSVSDAAELLHLPLAKVHYWVRSLYDVGLLEIAAETRRKGRAIKRYQAIASEFVVPAEVLPSGHFERVMRRSNAEMTDALIAAAPEWVLAGDFRIRASSPQRGSQDRVGRENAGQETTTHQSGCRLRITEDEARQLGAELRDLRDRWIARSQDESDLTPYQLNIALAPMPG
ncbi:hypothetical protein [Flexivirga alba]|uniref:ArsR family transcriptional regulator n=1 Tax=Flexivirga alba TaxID=702742 RepID=A0ABW2ADF3_9MICO